VDAFHPWKLSPVLLMKQPLISVVMPVFNGETYVSAAVKSIVCQSFTDFEFLIFDDGSTDRTSAILEWWARRDRRIQVFREGHRGIVAMLNEGIAHARGELIARMDADDIALPERFALQVEFLSQHHECLAVGGDCLLIDPQGCPIRRLPQPTDHEEIDRRHLRGVSGTIAHPSVMYRRDAVKRLGGYRAEFQYVEDLDLWLRLAEVGRLANLPLVLLKYRQHFQSVCHRRRARQLELLGLLLKDVRQRRSLPAPDVLPDAGTAVADLDLRQYWAEVAQEEGHLATARKHLWHVLQQKPREMHLWRRLLDATLPHLGTWFQQAWQQMKPWLRRERITKETDLKAVRRAA
jgi:GT2 family glycosyltransferase